MKLKDLISRCKIGDLFMVEFLDDDGYVSTWYLFSDLFRLEAKVYDAVAASEVKSIGVTRSGIFVQVEDPRYYHETVSMPST